MSGFTGGGAGFRNPVTGQNGTIERTQFQSANYVAGVSGWAIFRNGDAEFNQGSFRSSVIVGPSTGPQVKIIPNVNIPVTTQMANTGVAASDITSISNLQQVVELPSNNATETFPPMMGEVTVLWTDGSTSDGMLLTNGFNGAASTSTFQLLLSDSSTGTHLQCSITGQLSLSAGTLVLSPEVIVRGNGNIGFYVAGSGPVVLSPTGGALIPNTENWTAFNPLSNGWAVSAGYTTAAVRLIASPRNCIQFDALMTPGTAADGTIVGNLPARFRPTQTKTFAVTCDQLRVIAAGPPTTTQGARFSLDSAGNLKCFGIAAAATQVSLSGVIVPLDTN